MLRAYARRKSSISVWDSSCKNIFSVSRCKGLRRASQYPRANFANTGGRRWVRSLLITTGVLSVTGLTAWWFLWPHHTFPSSVASILRKGLWAESERGKYDYQTALKHYLEALQEADRLDLDPLSDEYTGIQLKIGEMYERLSLNEDALMLYSEISSGYLDGLTTPGRIADSDRPHIIQKDLRVILKIVQLNKSNANMSKMLLLTHFLVAQEDVAKKSNIAAKLINREMAALSEDNGNLHRDDIATTDINLSESPDTEIPFKNREAWEPFRDELFNARDLYVALCLATGDLKSAVRAKIATTEWMLNADCDPGEILMSQTNLGSLMYLQAEEFEAKEFSSIKRKLPQDKIDTAKAQKQKCVELALKCYESVLNFSKQLPAQLRRDVRVEESIALSTYGLGVVKLHLGELDAAKNLLRESRLRAKGSGFSDLVVEAEKELEKVNEEAENLKKGGDSKIPDSQPEIELDVQLSKNVKNISGSS